MIIRPRAPKNLSMQLFGDPTTSSPRVTLQIGHTNIHKYKMSDTKSKIQPSFAGSPQVVRAHTVAYMFEANVYQ